MALNNASNVSAGKPKVGGSIFVAPLGTPIPTDATSDLNAAFENVGYISEDGVTNTNSPESDAIKAWGGDVVYNAQTEKSDEFSFTMIEITNPIALGVAYGNENVSGTLEEGIVVRANSQEPEEKAYVIETVLRGTILKRIVIPRAQLTELGDITYKDDELVGLDVTISAHPDESIVFDTHREYIITAPDEVTDTSDSTNGD